MLRLCRHANDGGAGGHRPGFGATHTTAARGRSRQSRHPLDAAKVCSNDIVGCVLALPGAAGQHPSKRGRWPAADSPCAAEPAHLCFSGGCCAVQAVPTVLLPWLNSVWSMPSQRHSLQYMGREWRPLHHAACQPAGSICAVSWQGCNASVLHGLSF